MAAKNLSRDGFNIRRSVFGDEEKKTLAGTQALCLQRTPCVRKKTLRSKLPMKLRFSATRFTCLALIAGELSAFRQSTILPPTNTLYISLS